jgi:microcystin degradation protein MlrC
MRERPRVLVGQIFQETHGFTPLRTHLSAFAIEQGASLLQHNRNSESVLGGILRTGERLGWDWVPTLAARASPGGRVLDSAYAELKEAILCAAAKEPVDAVALCLHGCMQTESLDSAEADLLAGLRHIVGPDVPIVAGFDLHAHANGGVLQFLDFASAYKTNPHQDASATGDRVAEVLDCMLRERLRPVGAAVRIPMLTSGNDETSSGPLARLHHMADTRIRVQDELLDASIFNVNPFIDGAHVGQTVLVYARSDRGWATASELARTLAQELWDARREFRHALPTLAQALGQSSGKVVLGDFGDRVLAGAPGDSIYLVEELQRLAPERKVVAPVTDPDALDACVSAGVGAALTLRIGGGSTPGGRQALLTGVVRALGDGSYRNRGAFMGGLSMRIGPNAVFESGAVCLLITRDPLMSHDPGCFLDVGIDLDRADVVIVKSGYHFKLAFAPFGHCVCVSTPGLSSFDPAALGLLKARPLHPLDDVSFTPEVTRVGCRSR